MFDIFKKREVVAPEHNASEILTFPCFIYSLIGSSLVPANVIAKYESLMLL